jgi:GrxC family glutaredoxin
MYKLEIYGRDNCGYCQMAKRLLSSKGIQYQEYNVAHNSVLVDEMRKRSNRLSVPQIFLNQEHIGGFEDLAEAMRKEDFMKEFQ